ncbi:MAG TPA: hypothetical protein VF097_08760 [Actinomycetota bacterium]
MAVAAALVSGCGGDEAGTVPTPGPDEPTSTTAPSPTGPLTEGEPQIVTLREGLVDVRPVTLERIERLGPRRLLAVFYGGVEECYGVARVDVEERSDAVTLTVYEGRDPEAATCIEIAALKGIEVILGERVGDREVLDGTAVG